MNSPSTLMAQPEQTSTTGEGAEAPHTARSTTQLGQVNQMKDENKNILR